MLQVNVSTVSCEKSVDSVDHAETVMNNSWRILSTRSSTIFRSLYRFVEFIRSSVSSVATKTFVPSIFDIKSSASRESRFLIGFQIFLKEVEFYLSNWQFAMPSHQLYLDTTLSWLMWHYLNRARQFEPHIHPFRLTSNFSLDVLNTFISFTLIIPFRSSTKYSFIGRIKASSTLSIIMRVVGLVYLCNMSLKSFCPAYSSPNAKATFSCKISLLELFVLLIPRRSTNTTRKLCSSRKYCPIAANNETKFSRKLENR